MDLHGRVALVTGGASGLGRATAEALLARGARVALLDRSREAGEATAAALGAGALFCETDVTGEASVRAALDQTLSAFGAVHVLVGCAGVGTAGKVLGKEGPLALEKFAQTIQVNLVGQFNVLRLAAAAMAKNVPDAGGERGVIINTASVAAFDGQVGQAAYAASKAGLVGLTLPVARELAALGIRVCTIAPGLFDTPMLAGLPEAARASLGQQVPFPSRLGQPSEYAALALHICENTMLNGETIRLDGALRMAPR
jgi:NAD(P)-dependent dehydrogenase (short-subunit alcohol dehydrogenase family)